MTWLHLSDLHCCPERTGWDAGRVLRALGRDLADLAAEHELRPDLIFFTGDAAFGELPDHPIRDQFAEAVRFFEEVRERCGVEKENVFLVPGNHDVHRGEVSPAWTEWLAKRAETHALDEVTGLVRRGGRDWQAVIARLDAYRTFLEELGYDHLLDDRERLIYAAHRDVRGHEVAVAGLNSAWSCGSDGEKGRLWLAGDWQVATLEPQLDGAEVVVGLVHHPRSWLVEAEDPEVERLFERTFDFHLHGHEHQAWLKSGDGHVRIAAGACYDRSDRPNGYNLVRLDFENEKAEVWLRAYEKDAGAWQQRVIQGKTDVHGVWHLDRLRCFERRPRIVSAAGSGEQPESIADHGNGLVDDVFDALAHNPVLLLLAQEGRVERQVIAAIKARARAAGRQESVLHVTPPPSPGATLAEYFGWLGGQSGLDGVAGPVEWASALDRRLGTGERLFLLVNGFERGAGDGRRELGSILRSLAERHGSALSVVLCGGESLAALKYEQGRMSVLSSAERLDWPEPTVEDVLAFQRRSFPDVALSPDDAETLLELSGGHPRLLRFGLVRRRRGETGDESGALADLCEEVFFSVFRQLAELSGNRQRLCSLLEDDELGRFRPWIDDRILRRLYWRNALAVRKRRLRWRCQAIREAGRRVLGCE